MSICKSHKGPEAHNLCPVSGMSVHGITGESSTFSVILDMETEMMNFRRGPG